MSREGKVVCVTGASGFIASWLVKLLLQRGYIVKATVRDPNDPMKTEHLLALDGAKERLHLFQADLIEEGSFDAAVDGCEGVFHTASPVLFSATNPQAELIDPAVKGTLNVLKSCVKFATVKRDPLVCENLKQWYVLSKTLAEEAAWKFAEGNGIDLVTINPPYVIGPLLQPSLNLTVEVILNLKNDIEDVNSSIYSCSDVRDVASAHVQAFEVPSANGRYCLVGHVTPMAKVLKILHELHPSLCPPEKYEEANPSEPTYQVSQEKAKSLGVNFLPLEVSLRDTVESLKEKGFLKV
ncbi:tetraketide alpha-pyrone reductase 1 isoform X1 [Prunus yedoensis var. nudiflora]|uniref:Tetraketide alpha-pyrone reductase 1 isoform X1 n=1 Tax=Prunus yedoensis var. nudiflora TaxID=2094558 RepID=A0A314XNM5_PRUYE|nr:tetraketide alpha-pyrone reductase 1 isoform X1 [Prunus yedoensis var. nudiflora]